MQLAEKECDQPADKPAADRQWGPVREAVRRAKQLREQGKENEADAVLTAMEELYRGDKAAESILSSAKGQAR